MRTAIQANGQRIWQFAAEQFRPVDDPRAQYARDELMDRYVLAILLVNVTPFLAPMTLYTPFVLGQWPGGYVLAVPSDEEVASFPALSTPEEVARELGYAWGEATETPIQSFPAPVREPSLDVPGWVVRFCIRIMEARLAMGQVSKPGFCAGVNLGDWKVEDY